MKKSFLFIAGLLALAACKTAAPDQAVCPETRLITKTVTVAGQWNDEESESKTFINGNGDLVFNGYESMAVGVTKSQLATPYIGQVVKATTTDGEMNYSFSHNPVEGADSYDYFFIMPYRDNKNISTNGNKAALYVRLDSLQHPTATSFDPLQDYMISSPVLNAPEQLSQISSGDLMFKRIVAATCLTIKDSENILGGQPVKLVKFGFPITENADKKNNLISLIYLRQSEDYKVAGASGYADVATTHVSPYVKAVYDDGLAKASDGYKVWLVTLPVQKAAQTPLTVVVETAKKRVTRTVNIPKSMTFNAEKINTLGFDISGAGYVAEDLVDQNDYWSLYNAGEDIVAGGFTINKTSHPDGKLLSGTVSQADLQQEGLLFLDADYNSTAHLKLGANTILIGRYKDHQPVINMASYAVYLDKDKIILKNLSVVNTESSSANRLFVSSGEVSSDSEYAIIEDCDIVAYKKVFGYSNGAPANVVKSVKFDNCVIKMAGTSASYNLADIGKGSVETPVAAGYENIRLFSVNNCVIYAETASNDGFRRQIVDFGNIGDNYVFPTSNLVISITNNTLYNINANKNVLARAYTAAEAMVTKNLCYVDFTELSEYTKFYVFGLYDNTATGDYSVKGNAFYAYRSESQIDIMAWVYTKAGQTPAYNQSNNTENFNCQAKNLPFVSDKIDINKGYFPINTSVVTNGAGASYDTKPWIRK